MKNIKILLVFLGLALLQSCSEDETIIELNDSASLKSLYSGNRLSVLPIEPTIIGFSNATYTWKLGNDTIGNEAVLGFVSDKVGTYDLSLEIKSAEKTQKLNTKVSITKETSIYTKYITKVFDFLPAVGQHTNKIPKYDEGNTQQDMINKASTYLVGKDSKNLSLGGFGGYVVFGFDHTIYNTPNSRDFKVLGNTFPGGSEPGIIMVAYDKNKNGKPDDDEWYEIAGSEYKNPKTIKNYSITYYKPDENKTPVVGPEFWQADLEYLKWDDNQGNKGFKTKNTFSTQSYYPLWVKLDNLKFTGTRLPDNFSSVNGNWTGKQYAYGYADNAPNDSEDSNIDIDWAVDKNGKPVKLMGIDFIKVYTGVNQENWWLGEVSTEVSGAYDISF